MNEQDQGRDGVDSAPTMHDLVGAYVLNALDDRERSQFEEHLADCAACRQEVAELSDTVVGLGAGLEETPPPALRAQLLARVSEEPQDPAGGRTEPPAGSHAAAAGHEDRPDELAARRAGGSSRGTRGWLVGIAAAAAIAVGAVAVTQWPGDTPDPAVVAVEEVLEAPDAVRSTETLGATTVTVVTSASLERSVFVAEDMDSAPEGQDYQLWFVHEDGTAVSAGLMPRETEETTRVLLEGDPAGAVAVGVTMEPAGGSAQPTSDPLVAVPLAG